MRLTENSYNFIAGRSRERLAAISDGVFGFAMTLLVVDLKTPDPDGLVSSHDLLLGLIKLAPNLLIYLLSFMTLGIFWVGQQTQLNALDQTNRSLTWLHLGFLAAVTLMPFSTSLMAAHINRWPALLVYWANIFLLGAMLFACWRYSTSSNLLSEEAKGSDSVIERRIIVAQSLYAFGALLSVFSTYLSLMFIIAVQIVYVVGPKRGFLSRL